MSLQHLDALATANERRIAMYDARRRIREPRDHASSLHALADEIEQRHDRIPNLTVDTACGWVHGMRTAWRPALLAAAGCSEYKTIGQLTDRQRQALIARARDLADEASR